MKIAVAGDSDAGEHDGQIADLVIAGAGIGFDVGSDRNGVATVEPDFPGQHQGVAGMHDVGGN